MFKEYKLPFNSFIGGWFIPKKTCDVLVKYFNKNKEMKKPGRVGIGNESVIEKETKDSIDINIKNFNIDEEIINYRISLQKVLELYQKKYNTRGFPEAHGK